MCPGAFQRTDSKDPAKSCPRRVKGQPPPPPPKKKKPTPKPNQSNKQTNNTPPPPPLHTHLASTKTECGYRYGWIKKKKPKKTQNGQTRKNLTQYGEPRDIAVNTEEEERRPVLYGQLQDWFARLQSAVTRSDSKLDFNVCPCLETNVEADLSRRCTLYFVGTWGD